VILERKLADIRVSEDQKIYASRLGESAKRWIENPAIAEVLHVFPNACNLINNDGEILSIVTHEIGVGPFSVVLRSDVNDTIEFEGFTRSVDRSSPVRLELDTIYLGELQIELMDAEVWDPIPNWSRIRSTRDKWLAHIPSMQNMMDRRASRESFSRIVGDISSVGSREISEDSMVDVLHAHAAAPARNLCEGILTQDKERIREGAGRLAGLGGGLTPAGDDFIMGVLLGLRTIAPDDISLQVSEMILSIVHPRTNSLSSAWLKSAAHGEVHETWHRLFEAMVAGSQEQLDAAVIRILNVGHTSGADALAGFLTILLILQDRSLNSAK
jgi:hypothetical protein